MAALARASGGGLGAHILDKKGHKKGLMPFGMTWLPELLFGLVIGCAVAYQHGIVWLLPAAYWSYFMMERGHGTVYQMNGWQSSDPNRKDSIEIPIRPIFKLFGWSIYHPSYSWACMGLKGFMIGLPLFPFGALLAVLWPLSYAVKNSIWGEYLSGAFTGLCLVLYLCL